MLLYILSSIMIDLTNYIDGLENVQWTFNHSNGEAEIEILKEKIFLFFQDIQNIKISFVNGEKETIFTRNGYLIPINSKIKINANWTKYNDYIIGFFDSNDCDKVLFTNYEKDSLPLYLYIGKNICIYHLTKNSIIKINNKQYSKSVHINGIEEIAQISKKVHDKSNIKKERIIRDLNIKTILTDNEDDPYDGEDPGFTNNPNKLMYALGWISLCVGILFFYFIGFCGGDDCHDDFEDRCMKKCCHCKKNCYIGKEKFFICLNDKNNEFYEKTLPEFDTDQNK